MNCPDCGMPYKSVNPHCGGFHVKQAEIDARVKMFADALQGMITSNWIQSRNHGTPPVISFDLKQGQKYVRIVRTDTFGQGRSVHCFIDLTNGDVLKAAGWKAPVKKNPRSNIQDSDFGLSGVTVYGATYLR